MKAISVQLGKVLLVEQGQGVEVAARGGCAGREACRCHHQHLCASRRVCATQVCSRVAKHTLSLLRREGPFVGSGGTTCCPNAGAAEAPVCNVDCTQMQSSSMHRLLYHDVAKMHVPSSRLATQKNDNKMKLFCIANVLVYVLLVVR